MKTIILTCVLISLVAASGCWAPKSTITASNVTQPVLVGKVSAIKGNSNVEKPVVQSVKGFTCPVRNSDLVWSAVYLYGSETKREGSNTFDKQILTLTSGLKDKDRHILVIDELRYNVVGGYWLFAFYTATEGWMEGELYQIK